MIDLKAEYGKTFRVRRDENNGYIIPHKWPNELGDGYFFAYESGRLGCFMTGRKKFNNLKRSFPAVEIKQAGDQEIIFAFDAALFPGLAASLRAKRRRQYSSDALARMRQRVVVAQKALAGRRLAASTVAS